MSVSMWDHTVLLPSVSSHLYPEHPHRIGWNSSYSLATFCCTPPTYCNHCPSWFWNRSFCRPDALPIGTLSLPKTYTSLLSLYNAFLKQFSWIECIYAE